MSGYIGGSILASLIKEYPKAELIVQYRRDEHKDVLTKFSSQIKPVKGELLRLPSDVRPLLRPQADLALPLATLQDTKTISEEASKADVVINAAE